MIGLLMLDRLDLRPDFRRELLDFRVQLLQPVQNGLVIGLERLLQGLDGAFNSGCICLSWIVAQVLICSVRRLIASLKRLIRLGRIIKRSIVNIPARLDLLFCRLSDLIKPIVNLLIVRLCSRPARGPSHVGL